MVSWLKHTLAGVLVAMLLGAVSSYFFDVGFWTAVIIAAAAMVLNGLLAEWEDRRPGGFLNPDDPKDL